ncbi:hypothetical protein [Vibrio fortis]|uniref:hypothetical protein n=1 Tax=Vibrio fortis TaxID=212667 RepID=UPI001CD98C75|nr:hypothetical protein [Vibrio fortis]
MVLKEPHQSATIYHCRSCRAGVTAAVGSSINLFNLLGLILILGIGIDYTLFFAEQKNRLAPYSRDIALWDYHSPLFGLFP